MRNDATRTAPCSALSGEDEGHGQQENMQRSRRTTIQMRLWLCFRARGVCPLEGVPEE